jgi:exosome complex component RRP46
MYGQVTVPSTSTSAQQDSRHNRRADNRTVNQIRAIGIQNHVIPRSNASIRYTQGNTSLLIAVYGPTHAHTHHRTREDSSKLDEGSIQVIWRNATGLNTSTDIDICQYIKHTFSSVILLHAYPNTAIRISIQVVSSDGSLMSAAVNGIMLALMDVGIQCKSIIGCITMSIPLVNAVDNANMDADRQSNQHTVLLDPAAAEEQSSAAMIHLAAIQQPTFTSMAEQLHDSKDKHTAADDSDKMKIVMMKSTGMYNIDQYKYAVKIGKYSVRHIIEFIKQTHILRIQAHYGEFNE